MKSNYLLIFFLVLFSTSTYTYSTKKYTGFASYYTVKSSSSVTANGERFNENALTCAMRTHDFNHVWRVCNTANKKCVEVRNNDFGPNRRLSDRVVDLTPRAFSMIGDLNRGLIQVHITKVR